MEERDRDRLIRILALLGSDQPGERASAALAAHRLVTSLDLDWATLLRPPAPATEPKVIVRRVRDWDVDHRAASEARIRQLKSTAERQERQIKSLRTRLNTLADRERRRLQEAPVDESEMP